MKNKHNKKRNTAFVFEALTREATVAIIKNDEDRKEKVVSIVRKHFAGDSLLKRDLECYRSLYENQDLSEEMGKKILEAVKVSKRLIDPQALFKQQTALIKDINQDLSPDTFNNFVPNYKSLATIAKMFNTTSPKESIILEGRILEGMESKNEEMNMEPIDTLTFNTFTKKFNEKYGSSLIREQKELLNHYISSFSNDDLELKIFLNREIGRLKEALDGASNIEEISSDPEMLNKTNQVKKKLQGLSANTTLTESSLFTILKTQELVKEIYSNGSQD
jgi:hypothetical protein